MNERFLEHFIDDGDGWISFSQVSALVPRGNFLHAFVKMSSILNEASLLLPMILSTGDYEFF